MSQDNNAIIRDLNGHLAGAQIWMKFMGVVMFISGVINALSIIGILWAWLPIWLGVLLFQAAGGIERTATSGSEADFHQVLDKTRLYFVISGVAALVGILLTIVIMVIYGAALMAIIGQSGGSF